MPLLIGLELDRVCLLHSTSQHFSAGEPDSHITWNFSIQDICSNGKRSKYLDRIVTDECDDL